MNSTRAVRSKGSISRRQPSRPVSTSNRRNAPDAMCSPCCAQTVGSASSRPVIMSAFGRARRRILVGWKPTLRGTPTARETSKSDCRPEADPTKATTRQPEADTTTTPPLLIGAHIDHLGREFGGNSRATEEEKGQIHHGADDNASGTAGVFEIAQWMAAERSAGRLALKRDVIFAAWSGEEAGLLGSSAFAKALAKKTKGDEAAALGGQLLAVLNMDMIGRFTKTRRTPGHWLVGLVETSDRKAQHPGRPAPHAAVRLLPAHGHDHLLSQGCPHSQRVHRKP